MGLTPSHLHVSFAADRVSFASVIRGIVQAAGSFVRGHLWISNRCVGVGRARRRETAADNCRRCHYRGRQGERSQSVARLRGLGQRRCGPQKQDKSSQTAVVRHWMIPTRHRSASVIDGAAAMLAERKTNVNRAKSVDGRHRSATCIDIGDDALHETLHGALV